MKLTNEMIKKYEELVKFNNYGELLVEVAKDLKLDYFKNAFQSILTIHNLEGHLNHDLQEVRTRFRNELTNYLELILSANEYEIIKRYV